MAKKENTSVAKKQNEAVSTEVNGLLDEYAGAGQATSAKHMTIPYLSIVQAMSDYVKKSSPKYDESAQIGMFYDSLNKSFLKPKLIVIPVSFKSVYVKLDGTKYPKARYRLDKLSEEKGCEKVATLDQDGPYGWADGPDRWEEEYEIYMMVLDAEGVNVVSRFCVSFASTKMKKAKQLNSLALSKYLEDGRPKPIFAAKYQMTTITEKNKDGDEYENFDFYDHEDVTEPHLIKEAIAFFKAIEGGKVKAEDTTAEDVADQMSGRVVHKTPF